MTKRVFFFAAGVCAASETNTIQLCVLKVSFHTVCMSRERVSLIIAIHFYFYTQILCSDTQFKKDGI